MTILSLFSIPLIFSLTLFILYSFLMSLGSTPCLCLPSPIHPLAHSICWVT
jgi:hypothetical protein